MFIIHECTNLKKMRDLTICWRASLRFMPSVKNQYGCGGKLNVVKGETIEENDMESEPVMVPSGNYFYF